MELTQEQIAAVVAEASEAIRTKAVEQACATLKDSIVNVVHASLWDGIREILRDEVMPAVKERLMQEKPVLVEAAVIGAHQVAELLSKAMVDTLTSKLSKDYERSRLVKALFE